MGDTIPEDIFFLDRARAGSLQAQIRETVVSGILSLQVPAGARLPSTRRLSRYLGVSRTMPGFPDKFMPFMDEPPGAKLSSVLVKPYGALIRALRPLTTSTLNDEPKWRYNKPKLTTGYQAPH